jgi:hypothetical protein
MQQHRGADADRNAVHRGNQRFFATSQRVQEADNGIAQTFAGCGRLTKLFDIVAGTKGAGRPRDHDAMNRG